MAKKPRVKLVGQNGNAFVILGLCSRAAKDAGWSKEKRLKVMEGMQSGNYDNLLATAMKYFDVR